jgi:tRNA(Ile)-lysidine synthase
MDRPELLAYHPAVRARLLRHLARGLGVVLGEAGTRAVLEFISSSGSGRRYSLGGSLVLAREFDRLVLARSAGQDQSEVLEIRQPGEGQATLELAGRRYRVEWTRSPRLQDVWAQAFASDGLRFPLRLRGWAPGDRIRMGYGTKKLKKLFAEMQVPAGERMRRPVLADGDGAVIWVPGLARSAQAPLPGEGAGLIIALWGTDLA